MDVLEAGSNGPSQVRRCHLWCWAPSARPPEWEQRTLVVGGFSLLGLVAAAVSAAVSASGNRRRREEAIRDAAPRWRYVASGEGQLIDGRFVVTEPSGAVRVFDPGSAVSIDAPMPGWIRVHPAGGSPPWAIEIM